MTNAREIPTPERDPDRTGPDKSRFVDRSVDEPLDREQDISNRLLPMTDADPEVGLSQKGTDEDAVVRRETGI